jgi:hypothetical protein
MPRVASEEACASKIETGSNRPAGDNGGVAVYGPFLSKKSSRDGTEVPMIGTEETSPSSKRWNTFVAHRVRASSPSRNHPDVFAKGVAANAAVIAARAACFGFVTTPRSRSKSFFDFL